MARTTVPSIRVNSNTGIINKGNAMIIAPSSASKTINGSGSGNTGDAPSTFTWVNITITNGRMNSET